MKIFDCTTFFNEKMIMDLRFNVLNNYVSNSLFNWSNLENSNLSQASLELIKLDERFENLKKIQNVFLNCYYDSPITLDLF